MLKAAKEHILDINEFPDIIMEKGEGMYLWDTEENIYLDFLGGWAVTSLGHSPKVIQEALKEQSETLVNASPSFYNKPMVEFAQYLAKHSCFDMAFFGSSGSEANEAALKLARKYGQKYKNGAYKIVALKKGFHGRTLAMMSATGKLSWKEKFEPKVVGFTHVSRNDIQAMKAAIDEETCAVMLEPILGEGGICEMDYDYIQQLRKVCDETNTLLIFDEVQTGIGRTGTLFAYEQYNIEPDIMTLAKGIGGGFPLSTMLTKKELNIFERGDQGGTYVGQPLAMAVGLAVVKEVVDKRLSDNAMKMGEVIKQRLENLKMKGYITEIRGRGLMIAFDFAIEKASELTKLCRSNGLIIRERDERTIRLLPPLIVAENHIDKMIELLEKSMEEILIRYGVKMK